MSTKRPPKKILALDWDARTLRVVHAHLSKRGVKIDRLLAVGIPPEVDSADPAQMGRHIRRTLEQEEIATKRAIVDIPRDQAILNLLSLPSLAPDELPAIVKIQVAKELPFPETDAVIDFAAAPLVPGATTAEVLVAAVRHEVVEQYEATFAAAGLKLDRAGLRPYANKMSVCALLKHAMPERVLMIDVTPTMMEINVLRDSFLVFSRAALVTIPKDFGATPSLSIRRRPGPADVTDEEMTDTPQEAALDRPDEVIRSLLVEVTRSIEAYRATDAHVKLDHAVIAGGTGVEEALSEAIGQRLKVSTELYNPASTFGWEPDEGAEAAAFAAGLGLVLGQAQEGELHFDFLHPKQTVSVTKKRIKKARLAAAVVVVFLLAGGISFSAYTKPGRERLAAVEAKIAELELGRSDNKKFLKVMDEIRAFDAEQYVWVDVIRDVVAELPSNESLVLEALEANQKEGRIVLRTRAARRETATEAIRVLQDFRREGHGKPRFKVQMGAQTTKTGKKSEKYPYAQDLRITIREDAGGSKKRKKKG